MADLGYLTHKYSYVHTYVDMTFVNRHLRQLNRLKSDGSGPRRKEPAVFNLLELRQFFLDQMEEKGSIAPQHHTYFEMFFSVENEENQLRIEKFLNSDIGRKWQGYVDTTPSLIAKFATPVAHQFAYHLARKTWHPQTLNIIVTDDPLIIAHCRNNFVRGSQNVVVGPPSWRESESIFVSSEAIFMPVTEFSDKTGASKPLNGDGTVWIPLE